MFANADCTIYKHDKLTGGYIRFFIKNVYWQDIKAGNVLKGGLRPANNTTIFIYQKHNIPESPSKDIIVKGNCEFEFNNSSQQTISESLKELRNLTDFVIVSEISDCWYGGIPHYEILAK